MAKKPTSAVWPGPETGWQKSASAPTAAGEIISGYAPDTPVIVPQKPGTVWLLGPNARTENGIEPLGNMG